MSDSINPDHYKRLPAEAIEIIESMIEGAPDNKAAYLHGQAAKYDLRLWEKGKSLEDFLSDWGKHIWYALRLESHLLELIEKQKSDETQKASGLQSHKEHPFGEPDQPKWTPKIGDWVRIKKPADTQASASSWWPSMDKYDGQIIQVKEIEEDGVVHDNWGFPFEWLEPAEQPKPTLNSDTIPEGYRKLNDSSIEPRQRGDLRWSIAEKRYIEIGFDEIGYANRENWAACRKITGEATGEGTGEVKPPDGWRFLEHGEVIRKGDAYLIDGRAVDYPTDYASFGQPYDTKLNSNVIRRNRFERGERVVNTKIDECIFYKVNKHIDDRLVLCFADRNPFMFSKDELAPYIEDTSPEVTGEVAVEVKPPEGWRWLEVGETLRKGDTTNTIEPIPEHWVGTQCVVKHVALRRNRFKVGEKVVTVLDEFEFVIIDKHSRFNDVYVARNKMTGKIHNIQDRLLAPYIEETK